VGVPNPRLRGAPLRKGLTRIKPITTTEPPPIVKPQYTHGYKPDQTYKREKSGSQSGNQRKPTQKPSSTTKPPSQRSNPLPQATSKKIVSPNKKISIGAPLRKGLTRIKDILPPRDVVLTSVRAATKAAAKAAIQHELGYADLPWVDMITNWVAERSIVNSGYDPSQIALKQR